MKKHRTQQLQHKRNDLQHGSTLVIVIALLGLLAFTGMVFFSFANSERASAEYFSEAAKAGVDEPTNVWDHMLRHIIVGPSDRPSDRPSILRSPTRRHSMVRNMVGNDLVPYSGTPINVRYSSGLPTTTPADWLEFVDSPAARAGNENRAIAPPAPDVDFTSPDINTLFLAYKGWAIRDNSEDRNGNGVLDPGEDRDGDNTLDVPSPRYERIPVTVPSFFRPQYMKTKLNAGPNDAAGNPLDVPTDPFWAYSWNPGANIGDPDVPAAPTVANRSKALFDRRSMRPHPLHIAGFQTDGVTPIFRYLTDGEASSLVPPLASGGFPFLPDNDTNAANNPNIRGEMGIWTGSNHTIYELDADNDGDNTNGKEGIWLDLNFPLQEKVDSANNTRLYVLLHSVTIYDLDALIDLNIHGNIAGLTGSAASGKIKTNAEIGNAFISKSNLGLGPNEVNPEWSLRRDTRTSATPYSAQIPNADAKDVLNQFVQHLGSPVSDVEQANIELTWLLTGRGQYDGTKLENILPGRWGEAQRTLNALKQGYDNATYLPRAGRSEFDDNGDEREGEIAAALARIRPFGRPMDYAGTGMFSQARIGFYEAAYGDSYFPVGDSITDPAPMPPSPYYDYGFTNNPRLPWMYQQATPVGPGRWPRYEGYSRLATLSAVPKRFTFGLDEADAGTGLNANSSRASDDLNVVSNVNSLLDDPLEIIDDQELEQKDLDSIFGSQDTVPLHIDKSDTVANTAITKLDPRLRKLAPYAFAKDSDIRERFTTVTNSLRRFMMRYDPSGPRGFEFSADSDGADTNGDGIPDGDGLLEFPPRFYSDVNTDGDFDSGTDTPIQAYAAKDPFRPQVRRILTMEPGENKSIVGQLPLSINHVLDVVRNQQTPPESSKDFRTYMQRAGLRFRSLTDHPDALESDGTDTSNKLAGVYTLEISSDSDTNTVANESAVTFPPKTIKEREFWARRDRQKLARDIYVLLYLTGGANANGSKFRDYSGTNLPSLNEGDTSVNALYTHEQLRKMAQFAVNMVDAMDTDDVITKFEYDKNLGDGWDLDDDPYSIETAAIAGDDPSNAAAFALFNKVTGNGSHREDSESRGVVFGVEAQQLAFSEVLAFSTAALAGDHALSFHIDTTTKYHLFLELQNLLPSTVPLSSTESTTAEKSLWRVVRYNREAANEAIGGKGNGGKPNWSMHLMAPGGTVESVAPNDNYTIGTTSSADVITSSFFVNYDADPEFELIAPDTAAINLPTAATNKTDSTATELKPQCDLDVIHPDHATKVEIRNSADTAVAKTDFLSDIKNYLGNGPAGNGNLLADVQLPRFDTTGGEGFELVLQRRANPNLPSAASSSGQTVDVNPWVDVDRIRVPITVFPLASGDTATELSTDLDLLQGLVSIERSEPLDDASRRSYLPAVTPEPDLRYHTLGSVKNSVTGSGGFVKWQDHSDRDFASSMDLLSIPVVGPGFLTQRIGDFNKSPYVQSGALNVIRTTLPANASAMFLRPDFPDDSSTLAVNVARDNRWYRLFQFVEVPSRVHRMLGNYLTLTKVPGKLNINTMRHWEIYAGLIDNPMFVDRPDGGTSSNITIDRTPVDNSGTPVNRDRWLEMLLTRDGSVTGRDTGTTNRTLFYLPGVPGSKPFRSLGTYGSTTAPSDSGILDTMLRPFAPDEADTDPETGRHWLEVASTVQHKTPEAATSTHHQHQILSKVIGNTTTVSNTFVIHATAAYFEAYEDPATGLVRVGGRFDFNENGNPKDDQQRAMFIIDRTSAFDAHDPGSGDFSWERLVKARVTIE
jgi:hypothetical protein